MFYKQFFDDKLAQYSYLIGCQATGEAVVIDPMRDIDQYIEAATRENLTITKAVDTHIHADYISGLREFAERGVKVYGSDEGDADWKYEWLMGSDYDYELLHDGDEIKIGNITLKAWHTPGHTPEHLSYYITDGAAADVPMGLATGDFVFVGDVGRPDLLESAAGMEHVMEPSARTLYKTVEAFKNVPEYIQIWPGHGAGSACGKALGAVPETTVGYELRFNNSLKSATSEDNFVKFILEGQPEPPMYFARMKRDNKIGPRVLNGLPNPRHLTLREVGKLAEKGRDVAIIDTRERDQFAAGHLPKSLLSPMNKQFNTVAGSFVDEDEKIYLVVEEHRLKEAVTDLIRIGLDHIEGYITPADLNLYKAQGGTLEKLDVIGFEEMEQQAAADSEAKIIDVRKSTEFNEKAFDGALNFAHTRLFNNKAKIPAEGTKLVHCQTGGRSAVSSAYLKREGHDVKLVDDDFTAYMQAKEGAATA